MLRPGSGATRPIIGSSARSCPEVHVLSPLLSACGECQMCSRRSRCCLLASDERRCRNSWRDVEEKEEKNKDGKLILMLRWMFFEIPLQKIVVVLQKENSLNHQNHLTAVSLTVYKGNQLVRWRTCTLDRRVCLDLWLEALVGSLWSRLRSRSAHIHSK